MKVKIPLVNGEEAVSADILARVVKVDIEKADTETVHVEIVADVKDQVVDVAARGVGVLTAVLGMTDVTIAVAESVEKSAAMIDLWKDVMRSALSVAMIRVHR